MLPPSVDAVRREKRGEDIGSPSVLAYEQWRRFDTATLAAATDALILFSNDNSCCVRFAMRAWALITSAHLAPPLHPRSCRADRRPTSLMRA
jgi:hypothetical protein